MSVPDTPARVAVASQLVEALDPYVRDMGRMIDSWLESWPDMNLYRAVSEQIERIRMYSSALPEARVQCVELLIVHSELIHCLWRVQYGDRAAARDKIDGMRGHHEDAIAALRARCRRFIARPRQ